MKMVASLKRLGFEKEHKNITCFMSQICQSVVTRISAKHHYTLRNSLFSHQAIAAGIYYNSLTKPNATLEHQDSKNLSSHNFEIVCFVSVITNRLRFASHT